MKGENWFKVVEIQQAGTSGFKSVPDGNLQFVFLLYHPENLFISSGTWMMYNQNGPLLREM